MRDQRIRDPLHDLVEFNASRSQLERVLWDVLQTRPFQRLRRIRQLGFSDLVYPGATHSRFLHSIGVFHTARRLIKVVERYGNEDTKAQQALAAALLHDVGHGPFSHAFEKIGERFGFKMAHHEDVSDHLIRHGEIADKLRDMGSGFANDVADMVSGGGNSTIYSAIVSSQFDADRLDYMRRDRLMAGSQHSGIDFEWLMQNLEVGDVENSVDGTKLNPVRTFVLGQKAILAAEAYVLGLFHLYPTVYFHKTTRGAENIYSELLSRVIDLVKNGSIENTGLPKNHPLVKFSNNPEDIECVLSLDDTVIWGALSLMAESKDEFISTFSKRLRDRNLYKCIDVRGRIAHDKSDADSMSPECDAACAYIRNELNDSVTNFSLSSPNSPPKILIDDVERSPYKKLTEDSKGPLNQINIRTEGGRLVDLSTRSHVVAALKKFRAFRVYYANGDEESKRKINEIISSGVSKWPT
ncbi:HD domain-containing protein [Zavarzinia sp.]|uniref:HD domain-containing protein n=1 Tax=Zavarzinia sp. TaxID=2027920 RepID=UPI003561E400